MIDTVYADMIGRPWKRRGRTHAGYDCYGLAIAIYRRLGKQLHDFGGADSEAEIARMIIDNERMFVKLDHPEPWCLATASILNSDMATHIGVILPDCERIIHVMLHSNVAIDRIPPEWGTIRGYYRWIAA